MAKGKRAARKAAAQEKKAKRAASGGAKAKRAPRKAAAPEKTFSPAEMRKLEAEMRAAWTELGHTINKIEGVLGRTFQTEHAAAMKAAMEDSKASMADVQAAAAEAPAKETPAQKRARKKEERAKLAQIKKENSEKLAKFISTIPASAQRAAKLLRGREVEIVKMANELHIHLPKSKGGGRKAWVAKHLPVVHG